MLEYIEFYKNCDDILGFFAAEIRLNRNSIEQQFKGIIQPNNIRAAITELYNNNCIKIDGKIDDWYVITGYGILLNLMGGYKEDFKRKNAEAALQSELNQTTLVTNRSVTITNDSIRETNTIQQNSIKWNERLFYATFAVALAGVIIQLLSYVNDKDTLQQQLKDKDTTIQQLKNQLLIKENDAHHLKAGNESLKRIDTVSINKHIKSLLSD